MDRPTRLFLRTGSPPGLGELSRAAFSGWELPFGYLALRRILECAVLILAAPLLLGLFLGVACVVWWEFSRPVLLAQERVGKDGKRFRMFKLRSLKGAPQQNAELTAADDPRLTPVGASLRQHKLDELPQLWNVLKGDMSLIGPRPVPAWLAPDYERQISSYACRYALLPGLTGWAQVHQGYTRDLAGEREKLEYDLYYLAHLSWKLDLEILLRTVHCVISREHAL